MPDPQTKVPDGLVRQCWIWDPAEFNPWTWNRLCWVWPRRRRWQPPRTSCFWSPARRRWRRTGIERAARWTLRTSILATRPIHACTDRTAQPTAFDRSTEAQFKWIVRAEKPEAQLMLKNLRDAFICQSRSPNIVPFHMLVSYCAIVTLSLRRAVFTISNLKNVVTLKSGSEVTQGHWRWFHSIDCVRFHIL